MWDDCAAIKSIARFSDCLSVIWDSIWGPSEFEMKHNAFDQVAKMGIESLHRLKRWLVFMSKPVLHESCWVRLIKSTTRRFCGWDLSMGLLHADPGKWAGSDPYWLQLQAGRLSWRAPQVASPASQDNSAWCAQFGRFYLYKGRADRGFSEQPMQLCPHECWSRGGKA